jgi:hypothetical protein
MRAWSTFVACFLVAARAGPLDFTACPTFDWSDEEERDQALSMIKEFKPIVITNTGIGTRLQERWTPEYLVEHWPKYRPMFVLNTSRTSKQGNYL